MPLLKFKSAGRWANPPGQGIVEVAAGVPTEVCAFIAERALRAGKAELFTPQKTKPKAKEKPLPSPVVEADEEKAGPVAKEEKAEKAEPVAKEEKAPPKRTRKRKK